jgi:hypothetical protein
MGESLIQPCRVSEEGLRVVKLFRRGRNGADEYSASMTVPEEEGPANYVPAAAVIRRVQALIGITGRKACVGGLASPM